MSLFMTMQTIQRIRMWRILALIVLSLIIVSIYNLSLGVNKYEDSPPYSTALTSDTVPSPPSVQKQEQSEDKHIQEKEEHESLEDSRDLNDYRGVNEPVMKATDEELVALSSVYDIAITTPVAEWTEADKQLLGTALGQSLVADLFTIPETMPDFKLLTFQQRTFKALFQHLDSLIAQGIDVISHPDHQSTWDVYQHLESILYPWLAPYWSNAFHINNTTKEGSSGIVMCVGNDQFQYAATTIRGIRQVLHSDIPIEIFYIQEGDLTPVRRHYLETEFSHVKIMPIGNYIDNNYTQFSGWSIKPYAILASSFSQVIMMDADVFLFQKPDTILQDRGYQKTGALFFYDRTLFSGWETGHLWLRSFLPTASSLLKKTRWWKHTSAHEQESGIVVVDKRKSLLGLLATCKMNDKDERSKVSYQHAHGDKETFWIGFEMMQTPYTFIKSYGAVVGGLGDDGDKTLVCGNQLHLDAEKKPLWLNGGLLRDKNKWQDRYLMFTHYAQGVDWDFDHSCIRETDRIDELSAQDRGTAMAFIDLDMERRKSQEKIDLGEWVFSNNKTIQGAEGKSKEATEEVAEEVAETTSLTGVV